MSAVTPESGHGLTDKKGRGCVPIQHYRPHAPREPEGGSESGKTMSAGRGLVGAAAMITATVAMPSNGPRSLLSSPHQPTAPRAQQARESYAPADKSVWLKGENTTTKTCSWCLQPERDGG